MFVTWLLNVNNGLKIQVQCSNFDLSVRVYQFIKELVSGYNRILFFRFHLQFVFFFLYS